MTDNQAKATYKALELVPPHWWRDFLAFLDDDETSPEFLAFFKENADCQKAAEMALRADEEMAAIIKIACQPEQS